MEALENRPDGVGRDVDDFYGVDGECNGTLARRYDAMSRGRVCEFCHIN